MLPSAMMMLDDQTTSPTDNKLLLLGQNTPLSSLKEATIEV